MRQNHSCRNGRPIKLLNRSGPTIQNFHASDQTIAVSIKVMHATFMAHTPEIVPKLPTSAWNFSFVGRHPCRVMAI
jgi:hypothetical protein